MLAPNQPQQIRRQQRGSLGVAPPRIHYLKIVVQHTPKPLIKGNKNTKGRMLEVTSFHPQECRLMQLPPEICYEIWRLAVTASYDYNKPNEFTSHAYRPGHRYFFKIDTALLRVCKQIYAETALLPVHTKDHVFWYSEERGPPWDKYGAKGKEYFALMTPEQSRSVRKVHFYTQQYAMESADFLNLILGSSSKAITAQPIRPQIIKFTFRHGDWWFWESDEKLKMSPFTRKAATESIFKDRRADYGWGMMFWSLPNLQQLEIEFETVLRKDQELEDLLEKQAKKWEFPTDEGNKHLICDQEIRRSEWLGCVRDEPRNEGRIFLASGQEAFAADEQLARFLLSYLGDEYRLKYVVKTMRWNAVSVAKRFPKME